MGLKSRLKRVALDAVSSAIHGVGLDRRWVRWRGANGAAIVMYHAVLDAENRDWICPEGSITKAAFERQIRLIAEERTPISLSELTAMLGAGEAPRAGTVVITFDDGYLDTLRVAGPILRRYDVPATVFIVSDWVGRAAAPWIDLLYMSVVRRTETEIRFAGESYRLGTQREATKAFRKIAQQFVFSRSDERDAALAGIISQLRPEDTPPRLLMNWDELADWLALGPGYEIGVHTHTHPDLTLLSETEIADEVTACARELETRFGIVAPHFAYPYGRRSEAAVLAVREAGCRSAIATEPMSRIDADTCPFTLTRLDGACTVGRMAI